MAEIIVCAWAAAPSVLSVQVTLSFGWRPNACNKNSLRKVFVELGAYLKRKLLFRRLENITATASKNVQVR